MPPSHSHPVAAAVLQPPDRIGYALHCCVHVR